MDGAMWPVLPQLGVAGVLVAVVAYLLHSNRADREQHTKTRSALETAHDAALAEMRTENARLRTRNDELDQRYEAERVARWKAEDNAARYRRLAGVSDDDGEPEGGTRPPGTD